MLEMKGQNSRDKDGITNKVNNLKAELKASVLLNEQAIATQIDGLRQSISALPDSIKRAQDTWLAHIDYDKNVKSSSSNQTSIISDSTFSGQSFHDLQKSIDAMSIDAIDDAEFPVGYDLYVDGVNGTAYDGDYLADMIEEGK